MKRIIALLALTSGLVSASTVQVTFAAPSGVDNGTYGVLPYTLEVDGIELLATCYSDMLSVAVGQTWEANELTLTEAATVGQFGGQAGSLFRYQMVGVLSQLLTANAQDQIDLQQAVWNVFDPGRWSVTPGMAAYSATAASLIPTFNFDRIFYLESVNRDVQPFVITEPGPDTVISTSPEPGTLGIVGIALLGLGLMRNATKRK